MGLFLRSKIKKNESKVAVLLLIATLFASCINTSKKTIQPANIEHAYNEVYELYQQIGYSELDTLSSVFNLLDQIVFYFDSTAIRPDNFKLLKESKDELYNFLISFNEFHEEIYTIEDNLSRLEVYYNEKGIQDSTYYARLSHELELLESIKLRIKIMKKKADSLVKVVNTFGIKVDYEINASN